MVNSLLVVSDEDQLTEWSPVVLEAKATARVPLLSQPDKGPGSLPILPRLGILGKAWS